MLLFGLIVAVGGVLAIVAGLRGLWFHRAELPDALRNPDVDEADVVDRMENGATTVDRVLNSRLSTLVYAGVGLWGIGHMPRPVLQSVVFLFSGAILIAALVLYLLGT